MDPKEEGRKRSALWRSDRGSCRGDVSTLTELPRKPGARRDDGDETDAIEEE